MQGALETHVGLCLLFLIYYHVKLASFPTACTCQRGTARQEYVGLTILRLLQSMGIDMEALQKQEDTGLGGKQGERIIGTPK
jgi:hypothetical protein